MSSSRVISRTLCLLALLAYGFALARYLDSPLRFDETVFASEALGILKHGVPKIPYAEDRNLLPSPPYHYDDARYGLWHPPLFLYSLAGSVGLLGTSNRAFRTAPLMWFILSLGMLWLLSLQLDEENLPVSMRAIPLAVALMTPLLVDGGFFVDIDNSSLTFSLLLFAWAFLKDPENCSFRRLSLLALIFGFCLCSKLTSPFLFLFCVLAYHTLNGSPRKGLLQALAIGLGGASIFLVVYLAYCVLLDYPIRFMFDYSYWAKRSMYLQISDIRAILHAIRWNLFWVSPPLCLALAVLAIQWSRNYWSRRKLGRSDFLVLVFLIGFVVYVLWAGMWGKYMVPFIFAGISALAHPFRTALEEMRVKRWAPLVASMLLLAAFHFGVVPPLTLRAFPSPAGIRQTLFDARNLWLVASLLSLAFFFIAARKHLAKNVSGNALLVLSLLGMLAINPIHALKLSLSDEDRSPYRPFRERGFTETARTLNSLLKPGELASVPNDLGYYLKTSYLPTDSFISLRGVAELQEQLLTLKVHYIADSVRFPVLPDHNTFLKPLPFAPWKQVGDYVIFQRIKTTD